MLITRSSFGARLVAAVLCALFMCTLVPPATAAHYLSALRALAHHARVTAIVVRLDDMQTLAALNPDLRLRPASVSKLFTAAAALQQFGPSHRFVSRFASNGYITGHTLHGNLVFVGGGDPALDNRHLHELVARLRARGITAVTGDLIVDDGLWGGTMPCFIQDRCNARTRAFHSYSAPLSAAGVNFGTVDVSIYPGQSAGDATHVVLLPRDLPGYAIDNRVTTGASGARARLRVWRTYDDDSTSTLHLRGSLPAGSPPRDVRRAVTGAAAETARVLAAMLANSGVHIAGRADKRTIGSRQWHLTLARVKSATLAEQLIPMLAYSNNYMADTLALDIAAASQYHKPLTLSKAAQAIEAVSEQADTAIYPRQSSGGAIFNSGSGLSLGNKVSARDMIALLAYMYHQSALFPAFYGALPVPLSAPFHTLKQGNFAFVTRLTAKTGTLSEPVTVRALAGYFRLTGGGFGAYAFIINGTQANPKLSYRQTVGAYEHDMEKILAHY
jgi:D-alanyl-D-alanine carboxypeptidase/D-alanyl-D-alanine-endopeptidase (penicillin-binding protein 4)